MARLLFLLHKSNRTKVEYFPKFIATCISKSSNGTSFSLVRASVILLFRVVGKLKVRRWVTLIWHTFPIKLLQILSFVSKV